MPHHPTPRVTPETRFFFEECRRGRLVGQRCRSCGHLQCPPAGVCRRSLGPDLEPVTLSGAGTVYSYTVIHRPPSPKFKDAVPYVLAIVELAEGPRLMTNLVGCPPDAVRVGQDVEVQFEPCEDDTLAVPVFRPAGEETT